MSTAPTPTESATPTYDQETQAAASELDTAQARLHPAVYAALVAAILLTADNPDFPDLPVGEAINAIREISDTPVELLYQLAVAAPIRQGLPSHRQSAIDAADDGVATLVRMVQAEADRVVSPLRETNAPLPNTMNQAAHAATEANTDIIDRAVAQTTRNASVYHHAQNAGVTHKSWHCFTADVPVRASHLRGATRHWYQGQTVTVRSAQGRRVTVTPEHLLLTGQGWVRADTVQPGDHLLAVRRAQAERAARIGEAVDAALVRAAAKRGVGMGFDVRTGWMLDVVAVDGQLRDVLDPGAGDPLHDLGLIATDEGLSLLATTGDGCLLCGRLRAPGIAPRADPPRGTAVSQGDTLLLEDAGDGGATGSDGFSDARGRVAALIETDEVVGIEVRAFRGHVYDLVTEVGYLEADGLVVHNSRNDNKVRPTHAVLDSRAWPDHTVPITEAFTSPSGAALQFPGDPTAPIEEIANCVLGSTQVRWPGDDVTAVTRRTYVGEFIQIRTVRGHDLTVTSNHPILTPAGYVPAHLLRPHDCVLATEVPWSPDVADGPPRIEQVQRAATQAGHVRRIASRGMVFHGDRTDAEVEIVGADGTLRLPDPDPDPLTGAEEFILQRSLSGAGVSLGDGAGAGRLLPPESGYAPRIPVPAGVVGSESVPAALLGRHSSHPDAVGLTASSHRQAEFMQASDDGLPVDTEVSRHLQNALALGMTVCEIIEVKRYTGTHDVFNLSTGSGMFIGNGIVQHNCRCWITFSQPKHGEPYGKTADLTTNPPEMGQPYAAPQNPPPVGQVVASADVASNEA